MPLAGDRGDAPPLDMTVRGRTLSLMVALRIPAGPAPRVRHLRAPRPIHFPVEEQVPEGKRHLILRTFLFRMLRHALGPAHSVGSDQFVYWNARDPKRCLAPDVFVRLGVPDSPFDIWKTWSMGGAPDLAIEVLSPSDSDGAQLEEKLARYHEMGAAEIVRFDPEESEGQRLRVWDRVDEDLVERVVEGDRTPCLALGATWVIAPVENFRAGLRLVDEAGALVDVPEEENARALGAAEERVRQLEEELRRRGP